MTFPEHFRQGLARTVKAGDYLVLRLACFFASSTLGVALLAKLYGLAPMRSVVMIVGIPCCGLLIAGGFWAARNGMKHLSSVLEVGFVAGLCGTMGYDAIRIPFLLSGQRIFAPISAFGIWLADADSSSRFTEVIGWSYHYANGITFGVMYILFMRGRHWAWGIVWAFALETIAVLSPFGHIFSLSGNYPALAIAYVGHMGYGLPLGMLGYRSEGASEHLADLPVYVKSAILLLGCGALIGPLTASENIHRDDRVIQGAFRIEGNRLNPEWLRIRRPGNIKILNPGSEDASVFVKNANLRVEIAPGHDEEIELPKTGIYQVYVETERRSQSSFVIVDPVEDLK